MNLRGEPAFPHAQRARPRTVGDDEFSLASVALAIPTFAQQPEASFRFVRPY